jgi:hypothetical protein
MGFFSFFAQFLVNVRQAASLSAGSHQIEHVPIIVGSYGFRRRQAGSLSDR